MIRRAAWAGLISVKRAKPPRWVPRNIAPIPLRTLASGPAAATEDLWTNSVGQAWDGVQKVSSQERADGALYTCGHQHPHRHEALAFARESIKRNALDTRVVDLMVDAHEKQLRDGAEGILNIVGKTFKTTRSTMLTLQLLESVQEHTGRVFMPSTPEGLQTILDAMRPPATCKTRPSEADVHKNACKITAYFHHLESQGQVPPMQCFKAAILALWGEGDCSFSLQLARKARHTLGPIQGLADIYDIVLQQTRNNGLPDIMLEILNEMMEAGGELNPSSESYAHVLSALVKANRTREVLDIHKDMTRKGVVGNKYALSSVLAACARDPIFWKDALEIVESMRLREGEGAANIYHYTSAVTSCIKAQRWKEAVELLDRMEERGVAPTDRLLDQIMQATIQAKQWALAEGVFRAITKNYGHGSLVTYQSMWHFVEAMVMQKKLKKAINCVVRVQHFQMRGREQKETLDTRLLKCFARIAGVTGQALASVLMTMKDRGIDIHPDSYSIVIGRASKDGQTELALTLFDSLLSSGQPISLSAVNATIKSCKDVDQASYLFASLKDHGLKADYVTYSAMLHACCATPEDNTNPLNDTRGWDNIRHAERAKEVWQDMQSQGMCSKGTLVPYLRALMAGGMWELAVREREDHRYAFDEKQGRPDLVKMGHKLASTDAVVDGVICHGLVDNEQPELAIENVERALQSRAAAEEADLDYLDEDNHVVLAAIRACENSQSWETAVKFLEWSEARWAKRPDTKSGESDSRLAMSELARASRRRLYDATICLLDSKGAPWSEVRKVLERGMRNGAVSLVKDSGSRHTELSIDFHLWGIPSSRIVLRCILEDLLEEKDFLLSTDQYDLANFVRDQEYRQFKGKDGRWHSDSPDPRGRRREFVGGVKPSRFAERAYRNGKKDVDKAEAADESGQCILCVDSECWLRDGRRLSIIVGRPRPHPSIRHELEDFCTFRLRPSLRIKTDTQTKSVLTLEAADVMSWMGQNPTFLDGDE